MGGLSNPPFLFAVLPLVANEPPTAAHHLVGVLSLHPTLSPDMGVHPATPVSTATLIYLNTHYLHPLLG